MMSVVETLLSPFQFDFMINALVMTTLVAIPCALLFWPGWWACH